MNNFIVRSVTGVLFVAAIICSFLDPTAMVALFTLVTALSVNEFCNIINNNVEKVHVNTFICTIAGAYFFLAMAGYCSDFTGNAGVFIPYLITIVYLLVAELYLKAENPIANWAYTMLSQMYVALPLSMINVLAFQQTQQTVQGCFSLESTSAIVSFSALPLMVFVFIWVNDTGAYLSGSLLGKHKLFPRVSPGKSWEGSIGGGILVLLFATLMWSLLERSTYLDFYSYISYHLSLVEWLGLGLIVVFFGTWGDLVESLFKRTIGIKDSGHILPGHGGMLDRFDSSLLAMPAAVIYLYTLQTIR